MDLFQVFVTAFEELFELLLGGIQEDATLHAFVGRARSSSVSFEAVMDATGTTDPSGLDIGSFLSNLDTLCQPGGAIGTALASAIEAYNAMIVENHIGPGTAAGTGMHVTWPTQNEYALQPDVWNTVLFQREVFMTAIVPNYRAFLEYFLTASLPNLDSPTIEAVARNAEGETVCFTSAIPSGEPDEPDGMLYGTDVEVLPDLVTVSAGIGRSVSYLLYEYGVDLTTPLKGLLLEKGYRPEDGDTLYLYGGDVQGNYRGSEFSAEWNRQMYFLNISGVEAFEALYVVDQGDGSKNVPVLYFPEEYRQDVGRLQFLDYLFFNFEYWVSLGAKYGFLKFSVDPDTGAIDDNLILFTSVSDTKGFKEEPRSSKGLMIPLVYVEGNIQGRKINSIPGGFNQTLINWSDHIDYNIISVKDETILDVIPETDAVQVTLKAYDFTTGGMLKPEVRSFDVVRINDGGGDLWKDKKEEEQAMGEDLLSYGSSAGRLGMESVVAFATALLVLFSR